MGKINTKIASTVLTFLLNHGVVAYAQQSFVSPVAYVYTQKQTAKSKIETGQVGSGVLIRNDNNQSGKSNGEAYVLTASHIFYQHLSQDINLRVSFNSPFNPVTNPSFEVISVAHRISPSQKKAWEDYTSMTIENLRNGDPYPKKVAKIDLAIVKIRPAPQVPPAKISSSSSEVEDMRALGYPDSGYDILEHFVLDHVDDQSLRFISAFIETRGKRVITGSQSGESGGFIGTVSNGTYSLEGIILGDYMFDNGYPGVTARRLDADATTWIRKAIDKLQKTTKKFVYVE